LAPAVAATLTAVAPRAAGAVLESKTVCGRPPTSQASWPSTRPIGRASGSGRARRWC